MGRVGELAMLRNRSSPREGGRRVTSCRSGGASTPSGRAPSRATRLLLRHPLAPKVQPEVRQRRVGGDRQQLEVGLGVEQLLLRLDDVLVLHEAFDQALVQRPRDVGVVAVEVVQVGPEEVRRAPRLGRHELAVAVLARAVAVALLRAAAGRREHRLQEEDAGHRACGRCCGGRPWRSLSAAGSTLRWNGGGCAVHVPALDAKAVGQPLDVRPAWSGTRTPRSRRASSCARRRGARSRSGCRRSAASWRRSACSPACPSMRVVQGREVDDERRVGLRRIAHPDPDQVVALHDRVAAHAELGGDHVLARESGCTCPWARTSCRGTCSGCSRLRGGPGTAARRGGSTGPRSATTRPLSPW